ncbi:multidrug ABC transporter permease [Lactobacillus sp. CBA3605]|uniref:ABC transporter permease n=1 Tax=Lactobacillus sp. CBA3605 TaxID=2099788 RepID=UPI000CFAA171|nr:ABC transporter permease [Lactobacillus sp. CBA3605]AVK61366.1 multidrug ABC transporter permease [Lactobacillus sp. CBA3605]
MTALVKRHLTLYFSNKSGVFFSLLGALIAFILYLVFLKQNMLTSWSQLVAPQNLLDPWLIGGTLAVTAVTTTANSLNQMIVDRESGTLADLALTDMSFIGIQFSYLVSAIIIGTMMQLVMFVVMVGYFSLTDQIVLSLTLILPVLGMMLLSSVVWTTFNLLLLSFVTNPDSLGKIGAILGTSAGFFAGVYIPIGAVPVAAQNVMKITPFPYNAAIYRQVLMADQLKTTFKQAPQLRDHFEQTLGIGIQLQHLTSWQENGLILVGFSAIFGALTLVFAKRSRRQAINKV